MRVRFQGCSTWVNFLDGGENKRTAKLAEFDKKEKLGEGAPRAINIWNEEKAINICWPSFRACAEGVN